MRHETQRTHGSAPTETLEGRSKRLDAEPQSIHSGIDLEPDVVLGRRSFEQRNLLERMHDEIELVASGLAERICIEHAFEHDDAMLDRRGAQRKRFAQTSNAESIGSRERLRCLDHAVSVCVGLHDGQHARAGSKATDHAEVVAQRCVVDRRDRKAHS